MIYSKETNLGSQTWEDGLVGVVSPCRCTSSDRRLSLLCVKQQERDLPRPPVEMKSPLSPMFRIMNS